MFLFVISFLESKILINQQFSGSMTFILGKTKSIYIQVLLNIYSRDLYTIYIHPPHRDLSVSRSSIGVEFFLGWYQHLRSIDRAVEGLHFMQPISNSLVHVLHLGA